MKLLLAAFVLFASSACSLNSPDREAGLEYSGAFAHWFYQTNEVSIEAAAVQAALVELPDEDGLRSRLRELATTQASINAHFSAARVHPFWQEYHPGIVEAVNRFHAATAHLREEGPFGPIEPLVEHFVAEERALLQAVILCYTQSQCPLQEE